MLQKLKKRYIGDKAFYRMTLGIAVPIMIQNGISNFVSMLDNIMVGRLGTVEMTGVTIVNQLMFVFNICFFGAAAIITGILYWFIPALTLTWQILLFAVLGVVLLIGCRRYMPGA